MSCEKRRQRQVGKGASEDSDGEGSQSALGGSVTVTRVEGGDDVLDWEGFLRGAQEKVVDVVNDKIQQFRGAKFFCVLHMRFVKYDSREEGEAITTEAWLRHRMKTMTNDIDLESTVVEAFDEIQQNVRAFQREGSGWSANNVIDLEIRVAAYKPLRGSSFIPLPKCLKSKRALVNVKNLDDDECFKWSILAGLFTQKGDKTRTRPTYLQRFEDSLDFEGIAHPTPLSDIKKFEKRNPSVSVNVFGYDEDDWVYPLSLSDRANLAQQHVNLLLYSDGEKSHYVCISSMSRLFSSRTKHNGGTEICNRCLHAFTTREIHDRHLSYCSKQEAQRLDLPKAPDNILSFDCLYKTLKVPFVIYADMESFLVPVETPNTTSTEPYQKHVPASFCYYKVRCDGVHVAEPVVYRGDGVVDKLFECLLEELSIVNDDLSKVVEMHLTPDEEEVFQLSTECFICHEWLGDDRVRHHDHVSGEFFGAAHKNCNLQVKFRKGTRPGNKARLPVIIHNAKNYDTHLLMEGLGKFAGSMSINCIPQNSEKYLSFSLGELVFLDSLQFLNSSLEKLVETLDDSQFVHLTRFYPEKEKSDLLKRKGVFCYDYLTDKSVFEETQLPPKQSFYSKLTGQHISDKDYAHAAHVWKCFSMKTFGDYHDLYLKTDVLLLASVFEQFRNFSMAMYELDPAHFLTSPGLAWQAMLKMTKVKLELITDVDQYMFIESGIRGGLTFIGKRFAKANHEHCDEYDQDKDKVYIAYQDANNLYGLAMSKPLPMGGFRWLSDNELAQFDKDSILQVDRDGAVGYIFEVDLEYPAYLHNKHSCYPMAPERLPITDEMLSDLQLDLKDQLQINCTAAPKLVTTLLPKHNYVVHHSALQTYLQHGLILTKIHRVLTFHQSPWLKPYIEFNSELRRNATNDFQKSLAKLYNNAIFGKSMENVRNRCDVKLVNEQRKVEKLVVQPRFKAFTIFNDDLVGVELKRAVVRGDKPIYIGLVTLEESKVHMYNYEYNVIKPLFGDRVTLLYTDTDSFVYEIKTNDWEGECTKLMEHLDTSNYPDGHPLKSNNNKAVLGKFKDEVAGKFIQEFVALKPKMYSLKMCESGEECKRAKGVPRSHVAQHFRHDMYLDCLKNKTVEKCTFNTIRSQKHKIHTYKVCKIGLSCFDSKRYMLADGINTLPYGHKDIPSLPPDISGATNCDSDV